MICRDCQGSGILQYFQEGCYFEESCDACNETGYLPDSQVRENGKDDLVDFLADLEFGGREYSFVEFQEAQIKIFKELNQMDKREPGKVNFLLNWMENFSNQIFEVIHEQNFIS